MRKHFRKYYEQASRFLSNDIGIDLGTANTLVYVRGKGIIINEPSVVAVNQKTGQVVAVGAAAKKMLGRTPGHIIAVRPIVEGVISDYEVTEEMIAYLVDRAQKETRKILGPRVVVGVPSMITNVETRAVRDAAMNSGAREVHIVEDRRGAAIGVRLPIFEPVGTMIIDIGGGTTNVAVISLGGIVRSKNIKIAGDRLNNDIIAYIRNEFKILIGEKTAENAKITIGSALPRGVTETIVKGRDLVTSLPREVIITDADIRAAITPSIDNIIEGTREVLETTPPELISDIMQRGIHLVGGGALLHGMSELLRETMKIPIVVADDPLTAVARGTGVILEDLRHYKDVLIKNDDDLPQAK